MLKCLVSIVLARVTDYGNYSQINFRFGENGGQILQEYLAVTLQHPSCQDCGHSVDCLTWVILVSSDFAENSSYST